MLENLTPREIIKWHESPEDFHAYCSNPLVRTAHESGSPNKETSDWGGANYDGALRGLLYGSLDRTVLAQELFDRVVSANIDTLGRDIVVNSVVGEIPNVPAVLAGMPESMLTRQRTQELSSYAPIRVIVDMFASWQITQQEFIRRGIAAIAFTMVMNTVRPIDLYVAVTGGSYHLRGSSVAHMIRVDSRPLDLPRAVWMLSDPSFFRRLGFCSIMHELRPMQTERFQALNYPDDCIPCSDKVGKQWLKLEPQDIYIERMLKGDILAVKDPMKWVNNMIKQHMVDLELDQIKTEF